MRVGDVLRTVEDYEAVPIGGTVHLNVGPDEWHWVRDAEGFYDSSDASNRLSAQLAKITGARTVRSLPEPAPVEPDLSQILDSLRDGDVVTAKIGDHTITGPVEINGRWVGCGEYYLRTGMGALRFNLTSVEVVSRALPDWAADNVRVIGYDGAIAAREQAGGDWVIAGKDGYWTTENLNRAWLRPQCVEIVATFKDHS